jgi:hypothetical protein
MELDNLKTIWKDVGTTATNTSAKELEQLLGKRSKSPIAKLKRNLFWELMVVVVMYTATMLYYFIVNEPGMFYLGLLMLLIGGFYLWFYVSKRRLLVKMECVTCEVKSNLSTQLVTLEKYVKLYLWVGTLMIPVILFLVLLIMLYLGPDNSKFLAQMGGKIVYVFLVWIVLSCIVTIPVFFLNKWYVHKLYGQHVKKLKAIVNEMNELPFQ